MPTVARLDPIALVFLALGAVALLAVSGASIYLALRARDTTQSARTATELRQAITEVVLLTREGESGQRGYLVTDGDRSYLEPYTHAAAAMPEALAALRRLMRPVAVNPLTDALEERVRTKFEELARTIQLQDGGDHAGAIAFVRTNRGRRTMEEIEQIARALAAKIDAREQADQSALLGLSRTLIAATVAGAVVIVGSIAIVVLLGIRYAGRLRRAGEMVERTNAGLEERVRERTISLHQANEEVQRFAYIVSHDLRSPLVNVMGFTSELEVSRETLEKVLAEIESGTGLDAAVGTLRETIRSEIPEAVRFIRSSTERMDTLINAILRISREGQRRLAPEPVALGEVARRVASSIAHQLASKDATLDVLEPLPVVIADRLAVEQILANLIDNAAKYLDPGRPGRIIVRGAPAPAGFVGFEVQDNGRGIAPQDQERIFELFRRAGPQDQKGEGIGLAHARAVLRRLGGEIAVRSTQGQGSSFRVTLPRQAIREDVAVREPSTMKEAVA